jgi:hypothetical protein
MTCNSTAEFEKDVEDSTSGNVTELALIKFIAKTEGGSCNKLREDFVPKDAI